MVTVRADRVFGILRENNPELTGEKRRTIMKPPQVRGIEDYPSFLIAIPCFVKAVSWS